jgi:hypothetical protein
MADGETPPETPPGDPPETPPGPDTPPELANLDDHTRRYIERLTGEATTHRHARRNAEQELERIRREHETEQDRVVREAEERGRAAAQAEHTDVVAGYERRLATERIRGKAAGRFADADDAVRLLDLDRLLAETDERRREQAVDKALGELLEQKPYLATGRSGAPPPLITQGGRSQPPDGRPRERSWLRG